MTTEKGDAPRASLSAYEKVSQSSAAAAAEDIRSSFLTTCASEMTLLRPRSVRMVRQGTYHECAEWAASPLEKVAHFFDNKKEGRSTSVPLLFSFVLPPGGHAAPDMALGLVLVQDLLHLQPQRPVVKGQPLGKVLVYRGFADAELLGGGTHRRAVFYEVKGQLLGPLFQILFDSLPLPTCALTVHIYAEGPMVCLDLLTQRRLSNNCSLQGACIMLPYNYKVLVSMVGKTRRFMLKVRWNPESQTWEHVRDPLPVRGYARQGPVLLPAGYGDLRDPFRRKSSGAVRNHGAAVFAAVPAYSGKRGPYPGI